MKILSPTNLILTGIFAVTLAVPTLAADITFPVAELANCADKAACRSYCDKTENISACVLFAEQHDLMTKDQAETARRFARMTLQGGPGKCASHEECREYCAQAENTDECLTFAEKHKLVQKEKLAEVKKMVQVLKTRAQLPGKCRDAESCREYCQQEENFDECTKFAEKHKLVEASQLEQARAVKKLIDTGDTPGACNTRESCAAYCRDAAHREECRAFGAKFAPKPLRIELNDSSADEGDAEESESSDKPEGTDNKREELRKLELKKRELLERPRKPEISGQPEKSDRMNAIPKELRNGGATNLPKPAAERKSSLVPSSSLMGSFVRFLIGR